MRGAFTVVAVAILCLSAAKAEAARGPLVTSFIEQGDTFGPGAAQNFERMRAAGGTAIRTAIPWTAIAPAERPAGFDAADWRDGAYRWDDFERRSGACGARSSSRSSINSVPVGARQTAANGASAPRPADIAAFMRAAAKHYSGRVPGVPRIKYWQVWIEPNVNLWFSPQYDGAGRPVSPETYRRLVNAIADAVHAVRSDNVVIAGGLSPFTVRTRLVTVDPCAGAVLSRRGARAGYLPERRRHVCDLVLVQVRM